MADMAWGATFGAAFGATFRFASFAFSGTRAAASGSTSVWYRVMSQADYEVLKRTGSMPASSTGETFISPTLGYLEQVGYEGVVVQFEMKGGFLAAMETIAVRDTSAILSQAYPNMPVVSAGWMAAKAFFKMEGGQANIGLGRGAAVETFNRMIESFKVTL